MTGHFINMIETASGDDNVPYDQGGPFTNMD